MTATKPRVLFIYYTYTQQTLRVVEAMAEVLRERGCEVRQARIEFFDQRYSERFSRFPLRHAYLDIVGMLPAQLRRATGQIRVPDEALKGEYDLVCDWLADVVADDLHADPLVHEVRPGKAASRSQALRRLCGLQTLLAQQPEDGKGARNQTGRRIPQRHSFYLRWRPGPVAPVADQLPRQRRKPQALPRGENPLGQP